MGRARVRACPLMTEQLTTKWNLPETDPLLAAENRDRAVVTELTKEENGQRRITRVARHPIYIGESGGQESHVWTIRDVTQQKLAEEMRDQFVDTATHELRTPLANIKAYAETLALADVIDVEQQKQFLNTINSEATRLARFVDDLLSVSSMELGSLSLNKQVTDLRRMLNEVLAKIRPQVEEKRLAFEVALPEKMPEPELDKDKIATVLVNLLGNAVKYTPANGRVVFRVNITDKNIEVSVARHGRGHRGRRIGQGVREVLPQQRSARAGTNRHRLGPGTVAGSRAAARRQDHGRKRNQQGQHVHHDAAVGVGALIVDAESVE